MSAIREARERVDLTQQEVAEFLGVTAAAVSSWELGVYSPRPEMAKRLAAMLQITLDDIYTKPEAA